MDIINKIFNYEGCMGQKDYTIINGTILIVTTLLYYFLFGYILDRAMNGNLELDFISFIPDIISILTTYIVIVTTIKRLRDININPWFSVIMFVPFINIIIIFILMLTKSNRDNNFYCDE